MRKFLIPIIIIAVAVIAAFFILRGRLPLPEKWVEYKAEDVGVTFKYPSTWIVRELAPYLVFIAPNEETPVADSPIGIDFRSNISFQGAIIQLKVGIVDLNEKQIEVNGLNGTRLEGKVMINDLQKDIPVIGTILNFEDRAVVVNLAGYNEDNFEKERKVYLKVLDSLKVDSLPKSLIERYADKLEKIDLVEGEGKESENGNDLVVHYTGTLENGEKFDSSHDRDEPFIFTLGVGQVIPGWDFGLLGMKVGGKRKLVIQPELAYGDSQAGSIPPNSVLIFEVELLEIR